MSAPFDFNQMSRPNDIIRPTTAPPKLEKKRNAASAFEFEDDEDEKKTGRRKIKIEYIEDKSRRHITFSKRKAGIMKKAYELSTLTGTQVLLLVASETGHVYTFATPKLQPLITKPEGKNLIQQCLNAQDMTPAQDIPRSQTPSYYQPTPINSPPRPLSAMSMPSNFTPAGLPLSPNVYNFPSTYLQGGYPHLMDEERTGSPFQLDGRSSPMPHIQRTSSPMISMPQMGMRESMRDMQMRQDSLPMRPDSVNSMRMPPDSVNQMQMRDMNQMQMRRDERVAQDVGQVQAQEYEFAMSQGFAKQEA